MGKYTIMLTVMLAALVTSNLAGEGTPRGDEQGHQSSLGNSSVPEYRLGLGDVIEVKFFHNPRFNEIITVRPDGRIAMERIGEIVIAGMTPLELDSLITAKYSSFVQDPEVTVFVREFGGYQVYVLGEVNSPGGYPIQRSMTVLQALAAAGGTKDGAKLANVMVLRRRMSGEVEAFKVDLKHSVKSSNGDIVENDQFIRPLDIVYVPKTFIASASTFMGQVFTGLVPPVNVYLDWLLLRDRSSN